VKNLNCALCSSSKICDIFHILQKKIIFSFFLLKKIHLLKIKRTKLKIQFLNKIRKKKKKFTLEFHFCALMTSNYTSDPKKYSYVYSVCYIQGRTGHPTGPPFFFRSAISFLQQIFFFFWMPYFLTCELCWWPGNHFI
jgi:hypothetical protein